MLRKEIYTYKEICEIVGWQQYTGGCSKKKQLEELARCCKYHTEGKGKGTKFVIDEIYEQPSVDIKRKAKKVGELNQLMQYALLDNLWYKEENAEDEEGNKVHSYAKSELLVMMGVISKQSSYIFAHADEYAKHNGFRTVDDKVDTKTLDNVTGYIYNSYAVKDLGAMLKSLKDNGIITYSEGYRVLTNWNKEKECYSTRKATIEELEIIKEVEDRYKEEYPHNFRARITRAHKEVSEIHGFKYKKACDIRLFKENVPHEWLKEEILMKDHVTKVNEMFYNKMRNNIVKEEEEGNIVTLQYGGKANKILTTKTSKLYEEVTMIVDDYILIKEDEEIKVDEENVWDVLDDIDNNNKIEEWYEEEVAKDNEVKQISAYIHEELLGVNHNEHYNTISKKVRPYLENYTVNEIINSLGWFKRTFDIATDGKEELHALNTILRIFEEQCIREIDIKRERDERMERRIELIEVAPQAEQATYKKKSKPVRNKRVSKLLEDVE